MLVIPFGIVLHRFRAIGNDAGEDGQILRRVEA